MNQIELVMDIRLMERPGGAGGIRIGYSMWT